MKRGSRTNKGHNGSSSGTNKKGHKNSNSHSNTSSLFLFDFFSSSSPTSPPPTPQRKSKDGHNMLMNLCIGMVLVMSSLVTMSVVISSLSSSYSSNFAGVFVVQPQENADMLNNGGLGAGLGLGGMPFSSTVNVARQQQHARNQYNQQQQQQQQQIQNNFNMKIDNNGNMKFNNKEEANAMFAKAQKMMEESKVLAASRTTNIEGNGSAEIDGENKIISMDPNMNHVHVLQAQNNQTPNTVHKNIINDHNSHTNNHSSAPKGIDHNVNSYTKTTIPEFDDLSSPSSSPQQHHQQQYNNHINTRMTGATISTSDGSKTVTHNFMYYYYDSFTQSFHLHQEYTTFPEKPTPSPVTTMSLIPMMEGRALHLPTKHLPTLCQTDGTTYGYSDWNTLRSAIHEVSDAYSYAVNRWTHYNAALQEYDSIKVLRANANSKTPGVENFGDLDILPPPELPPHMMELLDVAPDPFVICPRSRLTVGSAFSPSQLLTTYGNSVAATTTSSNGIGNGATRFLNAISSQFGLITGSTRRNSSIHINAEDIQIECDACIIDVSGTHFSFGEHAKNVVVKGLTMRGATASSLVFHEDGADAIFEDCYWVDNKGSGVNGAVCDMNSTSVVNFFRCEMSDGKKAPPRSMNGVGSTYPGGVSSGFVSSLTLRSGS